MTPLTQATGVSLHHVGWRESVHGRLLLDDVTVEVAPGEALLVTGPSGSGKSTLVHAIAGLVDPDDGEMTGSLTLDPHPDGTPAVVGVVFQQPDDQTILHRVGDDVAFGLENTGVEPELMESRVKEALMAVGLDLPPDHPTEQLSGGQRQRLALAGALAMRPGVLILDEPLQALDEGGKRQVLEAVASLRETQALTLIVVDHEPSYWLPLVDRVVTLETGRIVGVTTSQAVTRTRRSDLVTSWRPSLEPSSPDICDAVSLQIGRGLTPLPGEHSLHVRAGEVLALTGPNGSGKTTLAMTLAGIIPPLGGVLSGPHGDPELTSKERSAQVAVVPQNPAHHHVGKTVLDDLRLAPLSQGMTMPEATDLALLWAGRLGIDHLADRHPQGLSGGEKRRVAVAAALTQRPRFIIFDEPTQSLDDASWVVFVDLVRELADSGVAVVIVTHDRELVDAVAAKEYVVADTPAPPAPRPRDSRSSWLRHANPLALIGAAAAIAVALIVTLDVVSAAVAVVLISLVSLTTGLPVARLLKRLIPIGFAAVLSGITIALYGQQSGEVYFSWGIIIVSEGSVELGLATLLRIFAIATPAVVLFTGIDATRLADGLAQLWRLPERFVIGALSGIRLVQLLGGDMATLRTTRRSRGVGDAPWWRRVFSEVFTLLVVALRRADTLALAMDARGFARSSHRTHYRAASWGRLDTAIVVGGIVIGVVSVGAAVVMGEFNAIIG